MDTRNPMAAGPAGRGAAPGTEDRTAGRAGITGPPPGQAGDAARQGKQQVQQQAQEVKREAREMKDAATQSARDTARDVKESAKAAADQAASKAREQAGRLAGQAKEQGAAMLEQQKTRAADVIGDVGAAVRRAADKLHQENDDNLAGYADAVAEQLESCGRYLREREPRQLVNDVADLTRRRPEWVLGGMYVAGLALARFLKASRPDGAAYGTYRRPGDSTYRRSHAGTYEVTGGATALPDDRSVPVPASTGRSLPPPGATGGGGSTFTGGPSSVGPVTPIPRATPPPPVVGDARSTGGSSVGAGPEVH